MKRILLICNEVAADTIYNSVVTQLSAQSFGACQCTTVKNGKEWNDFKFTDKGFDQIFVQVELAWGSKVREGYDVANELILTKIPESHIAHLRFLSTKTRQELRAMASAKHQPLVKSFIHLHLPLQKLKPYYFSRLGYNYLRNYCLTSTGQIDQLLHDLQKYGGVQPDIHLVEENIRRVIIMGEHLVGAEAFKIAEEMLEILKRLDRSETLTVIQHKLPGLIKQLEKKRDEKQQNAIEKLPYKAMLVEDDPAQGEQLKEILSQYFDEVSLFSNGEQAKAALEDSLITNTYQALFTDMELLEDGFDQPVMGVDLLDFCEENAPGIATRIITSLPRRGLRVLINKRNEHILPKNNSGSILSESDNLAQVFKSLKKEIEERNKYRERPGPKNGPFGKDQKTGRPKTMKNLYYKIKFEKPGEHQKMMQDIQRRAAAFFSGQMDATQVDCDFGRLENLGREENRDILELILLHRAIALLHNKENGKIYYGDFEKKEVDKAGKSIFKGLKNGYCDSFSPRLGDDAKAYFVSKLGFTGHWNKPVGSMLYQEILEEDLFPEEAKWLAAIQPKQLRSQLLSEEDPAGFQIIQENLIKFKTILTNNALKAPSTYHNLLKIKDLRTASLEDFLREWKEFQHYLRLKNAPESVLERAQKVYLSIQQVFRP